MLWFHGLVVLLGASLLVAGPASAQSERATLIRNVTLVDGTGAPPLPGAHVLIAGERISMIATSPITAPAGATVIDGSGKYLIPGLIDSHVHVMGGRMVRPDGSLYVDRPFALSRLQAYLYSGVTSVYDSGNNPDFIFGLRDEERAGKIKSPRIFATGGLVTAPGGYADSPTSIAIADFKADMPKLLEQIKRKPDVQKMIYDRLGNFGTPMAPVLELELFEKIVALFNQHGIPTTAHIFNEEDARVSLQAGINAFAHPIHASATSEVLRELAIRRVPVSTTITVYSHIAAVADSPGFLDAPLFRATVEAKELERQKTTERQRYITSGMSERFKIMIPYMAKTVRQMHEAGVVLALGTDRTWGASVHMELEQLAKAGIPLDDLVRIATLNGAVYLHREADLGSVERGKIADLVLLDADPTRSTAAYAKIHTVFKGGQVVDRGALDLLPVNQKPR